MSEEMQLALEHTLKTMRKLKEAKAEIERLRAALDGIIPFAVYSLAEMNKERNPKPLTRAIEKAIAALAEEKKDDR